MALTLFRSLLAWRLLALVWALLAGCAGVEIESQGLAPSVEEVALVAGEGSFARAVGAALEAESIRLVPIETAELLMRARFKLDYTVVKHEPRGGLRLSGGASVHHATGGEALWFGLGAPDANELELERKIAEPEIERAAVLTLTLVRRRDGLILWRGRAVDMGRASQTGSTTTAQIERAVRSLIRAMRDSP